MCQNNSVARPADTVVTFYGDSFVKLFNYFIQSINIFNKRKSILIYWTLSCELNSYAFFFVGLNKKQSLIYKTSYHGWKWVSLNYVRNIRVARKYKNCKFLCIPKYALIWRSLLQELELIMCSARRESWSYKFSIYHNIILIIIFFLVRNYLPSLNEITHLQFANVLFPKQLKLVRNVKYI